MYSFPALQRNVEREVFMATYAHACEVILTLLADVIRSCMTKSLYNIYISYYLNYL